jgi:hypothetical protein
VPNGSAAIAQDGLWGEGRPLTGRERQEAALLFGRPLGLKYRGRAVDERTAGEACELVKLYAQQSGQPVRCFKRNGKATEDLTRVLGALTEYDDVPFETWTTVVVKVLEHPWWGDGPPSIGVVFGPKILAQNLADPTHGAKQSRPGQFVRASRTIHGAGGTCKRCPADVTAHQANNQSGLCDGCYARLVEGAA